ncbi:MAG: 30S ribosomal protein S16 [Patescibacteria group bacterium]
MLKIRLQRIGRKHEPVFRLVVTESQNGPKSGNSLEVLGSFDSRRAEKAEFNVERIGYWMKQGAKVSDTIHNLLVARKVIAGKKVNALPKKKPIKKEGEEKKEGTETPKETKPQGEAKVVPEETKKIPVA